MVCIIVIGASEGGLEPLQRIVAAMPADCAASVFIVTHIGPHPSFLPSLLNRPDGLPVGFARDGDQIQTGHVYVAPPDHHMLLEDGHIHLNQGPKIHYTRPAIDPLFMSAADEYGKNVMGVVLSGGGGDGAFGLRAVTEHGGTALVQQPAFRPSMPNAARATDSPEALPTEEIAQRVREFCSRSCPGTASLFR
jgi:two-component system chemotaxis response regulator CheB